MQETSCNEHDRVRNRWMDLARALQSLPARAVRFLPVGKGLNLLRLPGRRGGPHDHARLDAAVLDSLQEQIAVIEANGSIVDVNRAWRAFAENNGLCSPGAWVGVNYLDVLSSSAAEGDELAREAERGMQSVIRGEQDSFYCEYPCHSPDEQRWFLMRFTPMHGRGDLFVVSHHDITLRKQAEERAEAMALHDELTGLANRRYFNLFLHQALRRSLRDATPVSLVAVDVDHFKQYNDQYGHLAGDQCLADIGDVLNRFAQRPGDLAVRMGGDEFALILGETDAAQSERIAQALLDAIYDLNRDSGRAPTIAVSVGAASLIQEENFDEDILINEADRAMYYAKKAGRNRLCHVNQLIEKPA